MKSNKILGVALIMGIALAALVWAKPKEPPKPQLAPKLAEALGKYTVPEAQLWDGKSKAPTYIYYVDPLRFDEFKAELDAGGEYKQSEKYSGKRNWEKGKTFAQWAVRTNGEFLLRLCKANNSELGYRYKKIDTKKETPKLEAALRKYLAPKEETWEDTLMYVYYFAPEQFAALKAEVDAGGEYYPTDIWTHKNRDWDRGKTYARWVARSDGYFELWLCRADNSLVRYTYCTLPPPGEPKTITITGFDAKIPVWTNKNGVTGRSLWLEVKDMNGAGAAYCWATNPGKDITFTMTFSVLSKDDKSQTENAWTGTGSYYIRTGWWDVNSGKDTYHTYSVNGVPAPVDINAAVTTLQWSDFVWFRDYN